MCEVDGGAAEAATRPDGELLYSPHGAAYVDGGLSNAAPVLPDAPTLTVSPLSGPQGLLSASAPRHWHLCPADASLRVPFVAPKVAGMRCYLSADNWRAFLRSMAGGRRPTLERWYERGQADGERFAREHEPGG